MDKITPYASKCRIASAHDTVLNSECVYTFHNPYTSSSGIVVNLSTFIGTIDSMAFGGSGASNEAPFVRIVKNRILKQKEESCVDDTSNEVPMENEASGLEAKVTKLGMGVDGGFQSPDDAYETISKYSVVLLTSDNSGKVNIEVEIEYNEGTKNDFPMNVSASVDSVIHHAGAAVQQDLKAWELDDEKIVSKYAESLEFVDNGIKISPNPSDWKVRNEESMFKHLYVQNVIVTRVVVFSNTSSLQFYEMPCIITIV